MINLGQHKQIKESAQVYITMSVTSFRSSSQRNHL